MTTIDRWEADAKDRLASLKQNLPVDCQKQSRQCRDYPRFLALIELLRKKDEALKRIKMVTQSKDDHTTSYVATEALALTDELK